MKSSLVLAISFCFVGCYNSVTSGTDGAVASDTFASNDTPTTNDAPAADTGGLRNCDARRVTCDRTVPVCVNRDATAVPEVTANGTCYTGACVINPAECLPIACNPVLSSPQCPANWSCDPSSSLCTPNRCPQC